MLSLTRVSFGILLLAAPAAAQLLFEPPLGTDGGAYATGALVRDVDEDGVPDAIVSHFPFLGTAPAWLPGQGDGSFEAPTLIPLGTDLTTVVCTADFNEDGHLDLVAIGGATEGHNVGVLFGNGQGLFGAPLPVNSQHKQPADAAVGDFDADGNVDLAIYNSVGPFFILGAVTVRWGNGDGSFSAADEVVNFGIDMIGFPTPHKLRVGDTNGDGLDDLVFSGLEPVVLSLGNRDFDAAPCANACEPLAGFDLALADVNGDGRDDALTPAGVQLAQPDGSLGPPLALPSSAPLVHFRVAAGDLDDDGLIDVAIGRQDSTQEFSWSSTVGDVLLLRGLGDGGFAGPGVVVSHVPQPRELSLADMDGDGRLDVVSGSLQSEQPTLRVLLNHTYGPGSPFTDLGGALGGGNGYPIQLASGTLVAGQPFGFALANGRPGGAAYHIVGLSLLGAPFKGGTLVPFPHLVNGPFAVNAQGGLNLAGAHWPAGGSGLTLWLQFWMPNGGGPVGFVATSGVRAQIP